MQQNKEYIEREALQKAINTEISEHAEDAKESLYERGYNNGLMMAYALLLKASAADVVEVRHGRWIDKGWDGDASWQIDGRGNCWHVYECSECNAQQKGETMNYCPNCGAKMDKEE